MFHIDVSFKISPAIAPAGSPVNPVNVSLDLRRKQCSPYTKVFSKELLRQKSQNIPDHYHNVDDFFKIIYRRQGNLLHLILIPAAFLLGGAV